MNMIFISSSEVKKYILNGEATNEIYIFFTSRDKIKVIFVTKIEFYFYYIQRKKLCLMLLGLGV